MKNLAACIFFLCLFTNNILSQAKPGSPVKIVSAGKPVYRFPAFKEGTVVYKNGIIYPAKLNYNIAQDEIRLINQQGDTISLADPAAISFISINTLRFYYDHGYLQTIPSKGDIVLAFKETFLSTQKRKPGNKPETPLNTVKKYFFGDESGHFSKADKEYMLVYFQGKKSLLEQYLKTSHTNFNKEKDLLLLLEYCGQLK